MSWLRILIVMYKIHRVNHVPFLQVFRMNLEKLSKPELLTLFSILEGELEARDLVIEALKVCCKYHDKSQKWQQCYYRFCKALGSKVEFRGLCFWCYWFRIPS